MALRKFSATEMVISNKEYFLLSIFVAMLLFAAAYFLFGIMQFLGFAFFFLGLWRLAFKTWLVRATFDKKGRTMAVMTRSLLSRASEKYAFKDISKMTFGVAGSYPHLFGYDSDGFHVYGPSVRLQVLTKDDFVVFESRMPEKEAQELAAFVGLPLTKEDI